MYMYKKNIFGQWVMAFYYNTLIMTNVSWNIFILFQIVKYQIYRRKNVEKLQTQGFIFMNEYEKEFLQFIEAGLYL